jgi:hemoglobin-like flavoprotein
MKNAVDKDTLKRFDESLRRCNAAPDFLDRFYETFLASSPKVKEKFAKTDFVRQKRALTASLHLMLLAADHLNGPQRYLRDLAASHGRQQLNIGAELYDLWLDSLLSTAREVDPEFDDETEKAWEAVMMVGIDYLLSHYSEPPKGTNWK